MSPNELDNQKEDRKSENNKKEDSWARRGERERRTKKFSTFLGSLIHLCECVKTGCEILHAAAKHEKVAEQ